MQKTMSLDHMKIRTSLVNPFLYTFCLVVCWGFNLYGQQYSDPAMHFVDSLNFIIRFKPAGSKVQIAASEELRARLMQVVKHGSNEQRFSAAWLIQEIDYKMGFYKALIPEGADTISNEMVLLEKQLKIWQDSIAQVQQTLKKIIEDNEQHRVTREKAVFTLVKIHDKKVLDYIFENEEKLRFTEINPEDNESDEQQRYRTGMVAILEEYFYKENTESEKWLLLNYLLHNLKQNEFSEVALVESLLSQPERFKSPELLLEFMYANASPGSQKTIEFFLPNKNLQKTKK